MGRDETLTVTFRLMAAVLSLQLIKKNLVLLQNEKGLLLEVLTGETQGGQKVAFIHSFILRSVSNSEGTGTEAGRASDFSVTT